MIKEIRNNDMTEINAAPVAVVDFNATWCGPCRMLAPLLAELAEEKAGQIKVGKVNVDEEGYLAEIFRVASIPTLIVFREGKPVRTAVGFRSKAELEELLK